MIAFTGNLSGGIHRESPPAFVNVFKDLYLHSSCCVKVESGHTEPFEITTGVRQGCILSPLLFLVAMDYVMRRARLRGIPWSNHNRLSDLDFADDIALLEENNAELQRATHNLNEHAGRIGLKISAEK